MAKHPHRLILMDKRTWRCTLEGCAFFVHLGLQHVLLGKTVVCWECGETFQFKSESLKEEMPKCDDCHSRALGEHTPDDVEKEINIKMVLGMAKVNSLDELTPAQKMKYRAMGLLSGD